MLLYFGFWEGEKGKVDRGYHDSNCFDFLNRENDAKKKRNNGKALHCKNRQIETFKIWMMFTPSILQCCSKCETNDEATETFDRVNNVISYR